MALNQMPFSEADEDIFFVLNQGMADVSLV